MKKKVFATVSGVILIALTLLTNFSQGTINEVRADGTCCPETGSLCVTNAGTFDGYYYKKEGSCLNS